MAKGRRAKVCFDSQQAAVLALRAALNSLGLEMKGYDLSFLSGELAKCEPDTKVLSDLAKRLVTSSGN